MSQLSCFLEMFVQLRSRATGCLRMMPLSMSGVMDLQRFRLMCFQRVLSQHLRRGAADTVMRTSSVGVGVLSSWAGLVLTTCSTSGTPACRGRGLCESGD